MRELRLSAVPSPLRERFGDRALDRPLADAVLQRHLRRAPSFWNEFGAHENPISELALTAWLHDQVLHSFPEKVG